MVIDVEGGPGDAMGVLDGRRRFSERWLSTGDKRIVPVPAGSHTDGSLARRIAEGCRTAGADCVLIVHPGAGAPAPERRLPPTDPGLLTLPPPLVLIASGLDGAILFLRPGHALVAGTSAFLAGAAPEGVEQSRARFARYARAAVRRWPGLESTARSFPPGHNVWKRPGDVPAGTATARQLAYMSEFAGGRCTGAEFAVGWLDARRRAQQRGERVRDPLETLLGHVFSLLEDYSIDPQFRGPEDLRDEELKNAVTGLLQKAE